MGEGKLNIISFNTPSHLCTSHMKKIKQMKINFKCRENNNAKI